MASNGTPTTKRRRLDYNEEISILVGSKETRFVLPKTVAIQHSAFFSAALSGKFKESKDSIIRLPEAGVDTFKTFVQWLYTREVVVIDPEEEEQDKEEQLRYERLAKLYVLGDQMQVVPLCNSVIDCILDLQRIVLILPNEDIISLAFKHTPQNSTLRKLSTDYFLNCIDVDWLDSRGERLPYNFLFALVRGRMLNRNGKAPKPKNLDKCEYHVHNDEVPKCTK